VWVRCSAPTSIKRRIAPATCPWMVAKSLPWVVIARGVQFLQGLIKGRQEPLVLLSGEGLGDGVRWHTSSSSVSEIRVPE
jgi:hypothetical protein